MEKYSNPLQPHFNIETPDFNVLHIDSTLTYTQDQEATDLIIGTKLLQNALRNLNPNKPTIDYLLSHYDVEYSVFENCVNDFITENMLSLWDLKYLCNLGISGIRNENEEFKSKYRFIKKVHCAFIEYCMESMGIDPPSSYTDLRDEAYLYYKYQDNAVEYVENELGISAYECGKESVEFPVYECLECGAEQLVHDAKAQKLLSIHWNSVLR